jgi:protease I
MDNLQGKKVAILTENGFEEVELTSPREALQKAGATVEIVSPSSTGKVKGWNDGNWSITLAVDVPVSSASPDDYDALLIPGGVINPDLLRRDRPSVDFAKAFLKAGKPVAAICHGPQLLIETNLLEGRSMTSFPSIRTDLINAGTNWLDKEVVTDEGLVTSRSPKDLEAFNRKMVEEIAEGIHYNRHLTASGNASSK